MSTKAQHEKAASPATETAEQNPVPATALDTPVLIQYSAPEAQPGPVAPPTAPVPDKAPAVTEVKKVVDAALDVVAKQAEPTVTGATATIKVLRSHPKLGAFAGDTTTIDKALAAELIAGGFAQKAAK